jgi:hypothetical protein
MRITTIPFELVDLGDLNLQRVGARVISDLMVHYERCRSFPVTTARAAGPMFEVVRERATAIALRRLGFTTVRAAFDERDASTMALIAHHRLVSEPISVDERLGPDEDVQISLRFEKSLTASDQSLVGQLLLSSEDLHVRKDPSFDDDWAFFGVVVDPRSHRGSLPLLAALLEIDASVAPIATYNGTEFAPLRDTLRPTGHDT